MKTPIVILGAVLTALMLAVMVQSQPVVADDGPLVINAVGDVSLPHGNFNKILDRQGPKLFDPVRDVLASGDLDFVNVETAVTDTPPSANKKSAFSMPPRRLDWLLDAGFNLISLANNHITDAGEQGIRDTLAALEARQRPDRPLYWSGVSLDPATRYRPEIFTHKGVRIAFFCVGFDRTSHALEPKSPVHQVRDPAWNKAIADVRPEVDLIIVSAHFGAEYKHTPHPSTTKFYRGYVDAGADLILGHHPHVIRGIEKYKNGVIVHSLGNFAFASRTKRHQKTNAKMYSMIAQIVVDGGKIQGLTLHPLYVNNLEPWALGNEKIPRGDFGPIALKGAFAAEVLRAVEGWSNDIPGNAQIKIDVKDDVGHVRW